ncbi:MerR family transcriptional regulator [Flavobacterium sp. N1994]|uniref:MerR family transcriptional regulator n=1 Tax=Flavobacterium sp. N1994 TaxID=2986827 RepID=UPI0022230CD5|nr:MerR family transcriptional regulator [Flavobacterium sp. N1994]
MNNVKSVFSIKDLENISGIKAHTIRIWEKRYAILEPMRTETNIRLYDLESLQKLLNITLLHKHGYKISNISKLSNERIPELVNEIISDKSAKHHAISSFKMAMMNFDHTLFFNTYNKLLSEKSFRSVFYEVFIPLLEEIGLLWQAGTVSPAHEHFISYLIKQKLLINTEMVQIKEPVNKDTVFILYLPMNEIHELGLMYLNYEILSHGYKSIYLGESVPTDSLRDVKKYFDNITYICYTTVEPNKEHINPYIKEISEEILDETSKFWLIGRMIHNIDNRLISGKISIFSSIKELVDNL